jgi:hypothetical protein
MSETPEFEEMEQIPWSALAARNPRPVPFPLLVGGGLILIVAAAFLFLQLSRGGASTVAPDPGAVGAPVSVPPAGGPTPSSSTSTSTAPATESPAVYSEADLMAIAVDDETRLAVMQAEWFVNDFFTVDGDPATSDRLRELLGDDVPLPHAAPAGYSYVEWVGTYAVESPQPGFYLVDVAYRLLYAKDGAGFQRAPVAAVQVAVAVDVDGVTTLRSLPSPVDPPQMIATAAAPHGTPVPDSVVAAARQSVPGVELADAVGSRISDEWELPGELVGPGGNRWPVVVHVADP